MPKSISLPLFAERYNLIRNPFNKAKKGKSDISTYMFNPYEVENATVQHYRYRSDYHVFTLLATENDKNDVEFVIHPGMSYSNTMFNKIIGYFVSHNCPKALQNTSFSIDGLKFELIKPSFAQKMLQNLKTLKYDKFFKVAFRKRSDGSIRHMTARFGVKVGQKVPAKPAYDPKLHGLVTVYDAGIHDYRSIPTDSLLSVKVDGKTYFVHNECYS